MEVACLIVLVASLLALGWAYWHVCGVERYAGRLEDANARLKVQCDLYAEQLARSEDRKDRLRFQRDDFEQQLARSEALVQSLRARLG
jgi:hypothetical protein